MDQQLTPEEEAMMQEQMAELQEEQSEEAMEDQINIQEQMKELYDAPGIEEKQNAHSFLHKAAFDSIDTVRTTWLSESELGRPLFSVRFLLDMEDIAKNYLDKASKQLGIKNRIANYFRQKIYNVTDSGMSNKGFAMNLNVTRKMQATKERIKNIEPQLKGGKAKNEYR